MRDLLITWLVNVHLNIASIILNVTWNFLGWRFLWRGSLCAWCFSCGRNLSDGFDPIEWHIPTLCRFNWSWRLKRSRPHWVSRVNAASVRSLAVVESVYQGFQPMRNRHWCIVRHGSWSAHRHLPAVTRLRFFRSSKLIFLSLFTVVFSFTVVSISVVAVTSVQ
jgi:hypothetical protein